MSWSINLSGTPEQVAEGLEKYSQDISGQSKEEFDEVKPHLIKMVSQNFTTEEHARLYPFASRNEVKLSAWGSGIEIDGKPSRRECSAHLESIYQPPTNPE